MRKFARIFVSLPGLVAVVAAATVTATLAIVVAIYDAILALALLTINVVVWLVRGALTWPLAPIRYAVIRWAYGVPVKEVAEGRSGWFLLTLLWRAVGRLPGTVSTDYVDALAADYGRVPVGYRILYLRLPGTSRTTPSRTASVVAYLVFVGMAVGAASAAWHFQVWVYVAAVSGWFQ